MAQREDDPCAGDWLTPRQLEAWRLRQPRPDGSRLTYCQIGGLMGISGAAAARLVKCANERIERLRRICVQDCYGTRPPGRRACAVDAQHDHSNNNSNRRSSAQA